MPDQNYNTGDGLTPAPHGQTASDIGEEVAAREITVTAPGVSITRSVDEATMSSIVLLLFGVPIPAP